MRAEVIAAAVLAFAFSVLAAFTVRDYTAEEAIGTFVGIFLALWFCFGIVRAFVSLVNSGAFPRLLMRAEVIAAAGVSLAFSLFAALTFRDTNPGEVFGAFVGIFLVLWFGFGALRSLLSVIKIRGFPYLLIAIFAVTVSAMLGQIALGGFWPIAVIPLYLLTLWAFRAMRSSLVTGGRSLTSLPQEISRTKARQALAEAALTDANCGPFALYLRPFSVDHKSKAVVDLGDGQTYDTTLERAIIDSLDAHLPVLAFGSKGGLFQPGAIVADDSDWQQKFEVLAERATLICVVPLLQAGTYWEIGHLKTRGYLEKTAMIFPSVRMLSTNRRADKVRRAVTISVEQLRREGFDIPNISDEGGVLRIGDDTSRLIAPFSAHREHLYTDFKLLFPAILDVSEARREAR